MTRRRRGRGPRLSQTCPGCGRRIRWVVYIPAPDRIVPGKPRTRLALDLPALADDDPAGSHAASPGRTTCRRVTPDAPLAVGTESLHTLHLASSPGCRDALIPNPTSRRAPAEGRGA